MAATSPASLFIVDNSDSDWKVRSYLREWCDLSRAIDVATGYFEIGALLALDGNWQKVDKIRLLMGDEVSLRTKRTFAEGLQKISTRLDASLEGEKTKNDFLDGVREAVWELHIGDYQVCENWHEELKGRTLSAEEVAHYHKIVIALPKTIRLIGEIDQVINKHGGWPGAFQTHSSTAQ